MNLKLGEYSSLQWVPLADLERKPLFYINTLLLQGFGKYAQSPNDVSPS